jgi:hypothetical protein
VDLKADRKAAAWFSRRWEALRFLHLLRKHFDAEGEALEHALGKSFRQGMFQDFALGIKGLPGRGRNRNVAEVGKNQAESLQDIPRAQPALLIEVILSEPGFA